VNWFGATVGLVERALSDRERNVLVAMIERASQQTSLDPVTEASRKRWLAQVPRTSVVGRCPCGTCPSVDLAVGDNVEVATVSRRVVLEATTADAMLLLFIDGDRLSYLELAPTDPDVQIAEFPSPELINFFPCESS